MQLVRLIGNPLYYPAHAQIRRAVLAAETRRAGPGRPEKVPGLPDRQLTGEAAAAYGDVIGAIDRARLLFLPGSIPLGGGDAGRGGEDQDVGTGDGQDTPGKGGGHGGSGAVSGPKGSVS